MQEQRQGLVVHPSGFHADVGRRLAIGQIGLQPSQQFREAARVVGEHLGAVLAVRPQPRHIELHLADVHSYLACHRDTPWQQSQCATFDTRTLICGVVASASADDAPRHRSSYSVESVRFPSLYCGLNGPRRSTGSTERAPFSATGADKQYQEEPGGRGTFAEGSTRWPVHAPRTARTQGSF